jgi:hypothetical protein
VTAALEGSLPGRGTGLLRALGLSEVDPAGDPADLLTSLGDAPVVVGDVNQQRLDAYLRTAIETEAMRVATITQQERPDGQLPTDR